MGASGPRPCFTLLRPWKCLWRGGGGQMVAGRGNNKCILWVSCSPVLSSWWYDRQCDVARQSQWQILASFDIWGITFLKIEITLEKLSEFYDIKTSLVLCNIKSIVATISQENGGKNYGGTYVTHPIILSGLLNRAGHFRYVLIFSTIKNYFLPFLSS